MRRRWPFSTPSEACYPIDCTARLHCTRRMARVPELASRDHIKRLLPLVREALSEAQSSARPWTGGLHGGPGLIGRCWWGPGSPEAWPMPGGSPRSAFTISRASACAAARARGARVPFLALLVSGGHTQLVDVAGVGEYRILGRRSMMRQGKPSTRRPRCSDAVSGGAALARLAESGRPGRFNFPRPCSTGRGSTSVSVA